MTPLMQMTTERGYTLHIHLTHTQLLHDSEPNQVFRGPKHRDRAVAFIDGLGAFERSERIMDGAVGP